MPADAAEIVRLADQVEQAAGADTDLDAEIALAVDYAKCRRRTDTSNHRLPVENQFGHGFFPPAYTASLDAAMSLVPEGWYSSLTRYPHAFCVADIGGIHSGKSTSPALALTAAALKARARAAQHDHEVG